MIKDLNIVIDLPSWGSKSCPLSISNRAGVNWLRFDIVLIKIGVLSRPPSFHGLHMSDFWAWLRYYQAPTQDRDLILRREWSNLDPHQKTILSDDWGVGFSTFIVSEMLDVFFWADTSHVIRLANMYGLGGVIRIGPPPTTGQTPTSPPPTTGQTATGKTTATGPTPTTAQTTKTGPAKTPDFIGLTNNGEIVVLECKGTQSSIGYSRRQVTDGTEQKDNLNFNGINPIQKLVGGIYIQSQGKSARTTWTLVDPEPDFSEENESNKMEISVLIIQSEICSYLRVFGLSRFADFFELDSTKTKLPNEWQIDLLDENEINEFMVSYVYNIRLPFIVNIDNMNYHSVEIKYSLDVGFFNEIAEFDTINQALKHIINRNKLNDNVVANIYNNLDGEQYRGFSELTSHSGFKITLKWIPTPAVTRT